MALSDKNLLLLLLLFFERKQNYILLLKKYLHSLAFVMSYYIGYKKQWCFVYIRTTYLD